VRGSFHIDQEFRLDVQDSWDKDTPFYLDGCQNLCGGRNRNLSPASKHTVAALPDLVAYFRFTHAAGVSLPVPVEISGSRRHLLENPTLREMNLVWVGCSKKVALRFSKTVLDSFFSFLPLRYEYREFDATGRTSTHADWIRPSVDP
jgi:hypothetical protein